MNAHSPYTKFSIIKIVVKKFKNLLIFNSIFMNFNFFITLFVNNYAIAETTVNSIAPRTYRETSCDRSLAGFSEENCKKAIADEDTDRELDRLLKEKELNGNEKLECDKARENLKNLESDIRESDACPGNLSLKICMEKSTECSQYSSLEVDDDTGSFLGTMAPALGGIFGGQTAMNMSMFGSSIGANYDKEKDVCQQTRTDWESLREQQDRLKEQMTNATDDINDNLQNAEDSLSEAHRSQKESLDQMASAISEYRQGKQQTADLLIQKQLAFEENMRKFVKEIQVLDNQIIIAEKELANMVIDQQNLTVQYIDDCNNKQSDDKEKDLGALAEAKDKMEQKLEEFKAKLDEEQANGNNNLDGVSAYEKYKKSLIEQLSNAKASAELTLNAKYDKCMSENNKAYQNDFRKFSLLIERKEKNISESKTDLKQLQDKLKTEYDKMTYETQSIAEQGTAQLNEKKSQVSNLQQAIYNEAQNVMTQNNHIQQLQQQLQQQNVLSAMTNAGAVGMFGINAGQSASLTPTFMGLGGVAIFRDPYEKAKAEVEECDIIKKDAKRKTASTKEKTGSK